MSLPSIPESARYCTAPWDSEVQYNLTILAKIAVCALKAKMIDWQAAGLAHDWVTYLSARLS